MFIRQLQSAAESAIWHRRANSQRNRQGDNRYCIRADCLGNTQMQETTIESWYLVEYYGPELLEVQSELVSIESLSDNGQAEEEN